MLKLDLIRGQKSGHRQYDYVMVSGSPEAIANLIASLGKQLACYMESGRDGGRDEPRFEGRIVNATGEAPTHIGGYFSITVSAPMHCAHPGCREEFDPPRKFGAAFRHAGIVCEAHKAEAKR